MEAVLRDPFFLPMAVPRHTFHWRPGAGDDALLEVPLARRLAPLVRDRVSSAAELVGEASLVLVDWLQTRPDGWDWAAATRALSMELEPLLAAHGWRGSVAGWAHALDRTCELGPQQSGAPRELLAEELGLWLGGESGEAEPGDWNGVPLDSGVRLPDRAAPSAAACAELVEGEVILVHGYSDVVALALEAAQRRGLRPCAVVSEGGPELTGRRLAERLARVGVATTFVYDVALTARLGEADRVWVGTEAIGAQGFVAHVGTRALLDAAARLEVPSAVLTTSDQLLPRGHLVLPPLGTRDSWLLWEDAPEGVVLEAGPYEAVPLDATDTFITEYGAGSAADLAVRALRTGSEVS